MDQDISQKLSELDAKITAVHTSVEKTRKYFLVTMWITLAAVLLPLLGLAFAIPSFLNNYVGSINGLM